ncbi:DUF2975 domain-containing protein [Alkalihalobacillus sp. MEB130]|uniref:DUF2975 domain-containing protein n=1 Tax=Alkalihalobacillus sp. MEB130 TaxID=2976704 RepID=UPI0028DFDD04|nr:DUF2975 domain-containing protein [Alkalihalobacillus sp. MEB130]MDT8861293.1 DUF2975 domain-containing protein [Alkalihalobacillus sp. MEB130]
MKQGTTFFLKVAVFLIGATVLSLGIFGLPWLVNNPINPDYAHILYPILLIMYATAIPYFIALYQAFRLLSYIDKNIAFSEISITSLKMIKYCAVAIGILYMVSMPFFYLVAEVDDAPGIIAIGLVIIFASLVIAVFAAVLQKLLQEAINIKLENDLTV